MSNFNENPKFVTHPDKITSILCAIQIQNCLCTLSQLGQKKGLLTSIIEVNIEQNLLILDEINSADISTFLQSAHKIKLSTYLNGVHLAFLLTLTEIKKLGTDSLYYSSPLPDRIYYPQRRSSPRLVTDTLTITWPAAKNKFLVHGEVIDISRGGMSFRLAAEENSVQAGDTLRNCHLNLPIGYEMVFTLVIRSVKTERNTVYIGGYFVNLSPQGKNKLDFYIAALEREIIRKRKNPDLNL
ncbi:MAG: flagellar brake protein [Methylicorpusculum sp.]|uniref:flagellar brake protein n=1 Tax=Methylicorpusculum sp. TaxID=2713644 RepID=UPI0027287B23|nr:flagellar brake protein [Methylicorpusculum sp.]MDO8843830.1 flagellar brake protein [Methylicorpusculum sp.]MDO8940219.1 flagellar brake protein [Methylicorpusculum sp.]MDP2201088.1 flagellar brake protein [Methylicorpusculum sp.]